MTPTGVLHFTFSLLAMVFGAVVLRLPKGTRWHRTLGHGYVWCMVGVVGTSFAMYNLTGRVTPFHIAAIVAGGTVVGGMWTVLGRLPKKHWIQAHATWMAWSYVGLSAALVAETLTRFVMPLLEETLERSAMWPAFWSLVVLGSLGTFAIGGRAIRRHLRASVASVPQAMRQERKALEG